MVESVSFVFCLQDVVTLSQSLCEEEDLTTALERYTQKQTKEDHAASYLSEFAFPQAKWVLPFFYLGNIAQPALGKILPSSILAPPIQSLCSETLTPYSEVRLLIPHCIDRATHAYLSNQYKMQSE